MTDIDLLAMVQELDRRLDNLAEAMLVIRQRRKDDIAELRRLIGDKKKEKRDEFDTTRLRSD